MTHLLNLASTTCRMRRRLPRPTLVPLFIPSADGRRRSREYADSLPASERLYWDSFQRATRARKDRERPYRLLHLWRRLHACHWAGWSPSRASRRWGEVGPKWLGGPYESLRTPRNNETLRTSRAA